MKPTSDQPAQTSASPPGPPPKARTGFLGWRMVGVAFIIDFIAVGFFFYSYSVFFKYLSEEFGGVRFNTALGLTIVNAVGALISPHLGRYLDRFSIKKIMTAGAVTVSLGFVLLSQITALWQFYLILGTFIALGTTAMGGLASSKLVANWFLLKRGTALGIATMGISLSGLVMPLVATWLIESFSWRGAFLSYAACTFFLVSPIALFFVINRPEDIGQQADGITTPRDNESFTPSPQQQKTTTRDILTTPIYWQLAFIFSLQLACLTPTLTNMVPYATDKGLSVYDAASILSFCAGVGVLGKLVFGWLYDHYSPKLAMLISVATQLCGLILLMRADNYLLFAVAASLFGFGMGGVVPLQGATVGGLFGRDNFGKVMGILRPSMLPIHVLGLPVSNLIFDFYGSYQYAFYLFIGAYLISTMLILNLNISKPVNKI